MTPEERRRHRRRKWPKIGRDSIIFFVGLGGIVHETLINDGPPRETLLILFATMIGLPAFLRSGEKKHDEDKRSGEPSKKQSREKDNGP